VAVRAIFGVVSLLVVLGIVAIVAMKQLKAVGAGTSAAAASASLPQGVTDATATVREQSQQLQQRVESDIARAMAQGADARASEPGQ
jgi:hypothetical protein